MEIVKERLHRSFTGMETNLLSIGGALLSALHGVFHDYGCSKRKEIITIAKEVYDEMARKIDLPLVMEPTETAVEQVFWTSILEPTFNALADRVCGPA